MYKEIFRWVIAVISQPTGVWALLAKEGEKQEGFLSRSVYPLIDFVTVAVFLGVLSTREEFDLELVSKSSIRILMSSLGGFYLETHLMNEIWQGIFKREKDLRLWLHPAEYFSSLIFVLNIVLILFSESLFLWIFILYTFYIVWEGASPYIGVEEKIRLKFVGFTTAVILLTPAVIETLLPALMSGLSFRRNNIR